MDALKKSIDQFRRPEVIGGILLGSILLALLLTVL
jgi:hypothetical protein